MSKYLGLRIVDIMHVLEIPTNLKWIRYGSGWEGQGGYELGLKFLRKFSKKKFRGGVVGGC